LPGEEKFARDIRDELQDPVGNTFDSNSTNHHQHSLKGGENASQYFANDVANINPPMPGEENVARDIDDELRDPVDTSNYGTPSIHLHPHAPRPSQFPLPPSPVSLLEDR
jgi:hypothetical protein